MTKPLLEHSFENVNGTKLITKKNVVEALKKFRKGKLELPNTKDINEYKCKCGLPIYNIHYVYKNEPFHRSCWENECLCEAEDE